MNTSTSIPMNFRLIICFTLGVLAGGIAGILITRSLVSGASNSNGVPRQLAKEAELGRLYTPEVAFRISKCIRLLTLLNDKDMGSAKMILDQDLKSGVSLLSSLSLEFPLGEQELKLLKEGEHFLKAGQSR